MCSNFRYKHIPFAEDLNLLVTGMETANVLVKYNSIKGRRTLMVNICSTLSSVTSWICLQLNIDNLIIH